MKRTMLNLSRLVAGLLLVLGVLTLLASPAPKEHVTGRCATCGWLSICAGNFRVRAEAVYDDVWAPDPACYLTDDEISVGSRE